MPNAYMLCIMILMLMVFAGFLGVVCFYAATHCFKKRRTACAIGYGIVGASMFGILINMVWALFRYC